MSEQKSACHHDARTVDGCADCDTNERFIRQNWPAGATHADGSLYPAGDAAAQARGNATDTIRTITMQGHPPIRTRQDPEELWLGHDYLDFGGRYLRAVRTRDGRLILWYHRRPAYGDETSTTRYIATLPGTIHTAGSIEGARAAYRDLGKLLADCVDDPSAAQAWLAGLGYSMIAEID